MQGTQVLLLEVASIVAIVAILQWIVIYTYLERTWWRGPIGRSLVEFAVYAMVTPTLFILSLFFHMNRGSSQVLAWVEIILLLVAIPVGMVRRSFTWWYASRSGGQGRIPAGEPCHQEGDD